MVVYAVYQLHLGKYLVKCSVMHYVQKKLLNGLSIILIILFLKKNINGLNVLILCIDTEQI